VAGCTQDAPQPKPPPVVPGLADFHSHQFAHLGFARALHSHTTDPADGCRAPLEFDTSTFRVQDLVREGLFKVAKAEAEEGRCYPSASDLAGQQMDDDSLKRAWEYGLRLLVVHAVNSEVLCELANLMQGAGGQCDDRRAINAQLQAAHDMEARLDKEAGGPGQGWYQVVLSPAEARDVINQGKLAVVLGVESANAFGCIVVTAGDTEGIPNLVGFKGRENKHAFNCGGIVEGSKTPKAIALMEHYWDRGARHFFMIHNSDGAAGGTALSIPLLHANTNPSRMKPGGLFNRLPDIDRVISEVRPPVSSRLCGAEFEQRCNRVGLNETGLPLARMIASYGGMIDIDHLSAAAKRDLRGDNGLGEQYPVVSSHSGIAAINHGDKNNEGQLSEEDITTMLKWDGAFGPIMRGANTVGQEDTWPTGTSVAPHTCGGTTESFIQAYRYLVERLKGGQRFNGSPSFVGLGFGSDFNGLAGWPEPRFGEVTLGGGGDVRNTIKGAFIGDNVDPQPGYCHVHLGATLPPEPSHVTYPFTSPLTSKEFDRSTLPWSGRQKAYDISDDGVAHVGMVPDMVEEMRVLMGLGDADDGDLEPLWHGAEAYLRTWEAAQAWSSSYTDEVSKGIRAQCRADRAELLVPLAAWTQEEYQKWLDRQRQALERLSKAGCYGSPPPEPTATPTPEPTPTPTPGELVRVPDVVGDTAVEARNTLLAAGFDVRRGDAPDPFCESIGAVKKQNPAAGTMAPRGSTVTIGIGVPPSSGCRDGER
jgi:microsomal dipeptidase-like Zn-dependent dipeptidase